MTPESFHDFFTATASVSGALIGLLFVAITVSRERLGGPGLDPQIHRLRAKAALIAFLNTLAVGLSALIPGNEIGRAALSMAILGSASVAGWLLPLIRVRGARWNNLLDAAFLIGLGAIFAIQLIQGLDVTTHPGDSGAVHTIAILLIVCFLAGIARAWELIGVPSPIEAGHGPSAHAKQERSDGRRARTTGSETSSHPNGHER